MAAFYGREREEKNWGRGADALPRRIVNSRGIFPVAAGITSLPALVLQKLS